MEYWSTYDFLDILDFSKFRVPIYPKERNCIKGTHFYQSMHVQFAGNRTHDLGIAIATIFCVKYIFFF